MDLRYDNQIIVNPDMQRTAKAGGVESRRRESSCGYGSEAGGDDHSVAPNDRVVPKPAFELTEKKVDPKGAANGGKKTTARAKRKKTAKAGKATAGAKTVSAKSVPLAPATGQAVDVKSAHQGAQSSSRSAGRFPAARRAASHSGQAADWWAEAQSRRGKDPGE